MTLTRHKQPFTLYKRSTGKATVFYYKVYDSNGKQVAFSTGLTSKTAAMAYCMELFRTGKLVPKTIDEIKFSDFAKDFWVYDKSHYIKGIIARGGSFGRRFAEIRDASTQKHLIPYFGDMPLHKITVREVEKWLLQFPDKGLSGATANQNLTSLRIMLNEAVKAGYLEKNPCDSVKPLKENTKERGILNKDEALTLLNPQNAKQYWENKLVYLGNCLAAITGLRKGEVMALQVSDIYPDHITVSHSYDKFGEKDTKTHKKREIPLPKMMYDMIMELAPESGYIFSYNDGETPFEGDTLKRALYSALAKMGISEKERKERNICFHSWRHFFNTRLRSENISDSKTQSITGHSTKEMTEHYTHFNASDFVEVTVIQEAVLGRNKEKQVSQEVNRKEIQKTESVTPEGERNE